MEYDGMTEEWGVSSTQSSGQYSLKVIFYLHLPFPSYEIFRQLPLRTSLLRGVLASDLIGTHTYSSARHFISSCCRHLGVTQHTEQVRAPGGLQRRTPTSACSGGAAASACTSATWASTTTCRRVPRLTRSTSTPSCTARRWTRCTRSSHRRRRGV